MNVYKYLMKGSRPLPYTTANVLVVLISAFWTQIWKTDLDLQSFWWNCHIFWLVPYILKFLFVESTCKLKHMQRCFCMIDDCHGTCRLKIHKAGNKYKD